MTCASAGTATVPVAPTAAMRPSRTTIVCPSRAAAPVPSITRTFVSANTFVSTFTYERVAGPTGARCAMARWASEGAAAANTSAAPAIRAMVRGIAQYLSIAAALAFTDASGLVGWSCSMNQC